MKEASKIEYNFTAEARDKDGYLKAIRYVHHKNNQETEFVPNRIYMYLLRKGIIKSNTYKIPILLGTRKGI